MKEVDLPGLAACNLLHSSTKYSKYELGYLFLPVCTVIRFGVEYRATCWLKLAGSGKTESCAGKHPTGDELQQKKNILQESARIKLVKISF